MQLFITLGTAALGGWLATRLRWPAGSMIGAIVAVAALNILTGQAQLPDEISLVVKITSGMIIGSRITREDVLGLRSLVKPMLMTIAVMLLFCMGVGWGIGLICGYSPATALLACAPGGIVDITMIGMDVGADTTVISVLQAVRLAAVVGLFPTLLGWVIRRLKKGDHQPLNKQPGKDAPQPASDPVSLRWRARGFGVTLAVAAACGTLGHLLRIPAGALTFSMMGCAVQSILLGNSFLPGSLKALAQTLAGALIGAGITMAVVLELRSILLPALLMLVGLFLVNLLLALLLHRWGGLDLSTAFFCCTPGGASEISLMAGELGANQAQVSVLQIVRSIAVVVVYPLLVYAVG